MKTSISPAEKLTTWHISIETALHFRRLHVDLHFGIMHEHIEDERRCFDEKSSFQLSHRDAWLEPSKRERAHALTAGLKLRWRVFLRSVEQWAAKIASPIIAQLWVSSCYWLSVVFEKSFLLRVLDSSIGKLYRWHCAKVWNLVFVYLIWPMCMYAFRALLNSFILGMV